MQSGPWYISGRYREGSRSSEVAINRGSSVVRSINYCGVCISCDLQTSDVDSYCEDELLLFVGDRLVQHCSQSHVHRGVSEEDININIIKMCCCLISRNNNNHTTN